LIFTETVLKKLKHERLHIIPIFPYNFPAKKKIAYGTHYLSSAGVWPGHKAQIVI
jgi:hypothetical protein